MLPPRPSSGPIVGRRRAIAVAGAAGISTLILPRAAAHASDAASVVAGYSTVPAVAAEGPMVLYVDAMNRASYPGTGTVWSDLSGDGNDVTFAAAPTQHPTFVTDVPTGLSWFAFDGNDYFDIDLAASEKIANVAPYTGSTGYSIEAWVWDTGIGTNRNIVSGADRFLFCYGSSLQAGGDGQYFDLVSSAFPTNRWTYVAFTYDTASARATLYVDAVQKAQRTTTVNYVRNDRLTVGAHNLATPTSFWNGRIAEFRLYARELSGTEVTDRYDATRNRYPVP